MVLITKVYQTSASFIGKSQKLTWQSTANTLSSASHHISLIDQCQIPEEALQL